MDSLPPQQWTCRFCGHGEYIVPIPQGTLVWHRRQEHEDQCDCRASFSMGDCSVNVTCGVRWDYDRRQWRAGDPELPQFDAWSDWRPLAVLEHLKLRLGPTT